MNTDLSREAARRICQVGLLLALSAGLAMVNSAVAQTPAPSTQPGGRVVTVFVHQSVTVDAPWAIEGVAVTDPKIAYVQRPERPNSRLAIVQGVAIGTTDLLFWNDKDETWQAQIRVEPDLTAIEQGLRRILPGRSLQFAQAQDTLVVSGTLLRAEEVQILRKYLEASGLKFVDATTLAGLQQVQLQVRVAEASRNAIRTLGVNFFGVGTDFFGGQTVGSASGGPLNPVSIGVPGGANAVTANLPFNFTNSVGVSPAVTVFGGIPAANFEFFIQALAENQYLRLLAEPTLVAMSGEEARFLAGGEFPIPVVQGTSTTGNAITVQYKEFGVRLRFRPTVMGDGTIRLEVAPEVSQLSNVGAVVIQGFSIPSVQTRKAETTLELKSGQSFAMAGLIERDSTGVNSRIPGLGDIPVLGAFFRSVRYTAGETEIVVLVTATLVEPSAGLGNATLPGMLHCPPNDWELYAEGKLEGKGMARLSLAQSQWLQEKGLDKLYGPGAWADYDMMPGQDRVWRQGPIAAPVAATQPAEKK